MKTDQEINKDILRITGTITEKFPELLKFIEEMPLRIKYTGGDDIDTRHLEEYYNSLETLLEKYSKDHAAIIK